MGVSVVRDITELVDFSLNQSIAASSDYEQVIALSRDDWETAYITLWDMDVGKELRRSMFVIATRDTDEAFAQSIYDRIDFMPKGYISYQIDNWDYVGYSYILDSRLSANSYGTTNGKFVYLKKTEIDGSDLKLTWHNNKTSAEILKAGGTAKISRTKLR